MHCNRLIAPIAICSLPNSQKNRFGRFVIYQFLSIPSNTLHRRYFINNLHTNYVYINDKGLNPAAMGRTFLKVVSDLIFYVWNRTVKVKRHPTRIITSLMRMHVSVIWRKVLNLATLVLLFNLFYFFYFCCCFALFFQEWKLSNS